MLAICRKCFGINNVSFFVRNGILVITSPGPIKLFAILDKPQSVPKERRRRRAEKRSSKRVFLESPFLPKPSRKCFRINHVSFSSTMVFSGSFPQGSPNAFCPWSHKPVSLNGRLENCKMGGCKEIRQPFAKTNPSPTPRQPFANLSPTFRQPFANLFCQPLGSEKGVFWKRGLFRNVHFLEILEILENSEILEFLENSQTVENKGEIRPFSRDSRESRDFRDSRDSASEKTPFVTTPFSRPKAPLQHPLSEDLRHPPV